LKFKMDRKIMNLPMAVVNDVEIEKIVFVGHQYNNVVNQSLIYFYDVNGNPMMSEDCEICDCSKTDQIVYNECKEATLMLIENKWVWVRKTFCDHDKFKNGEIKTIPSTIPNGFDITVL